MRTGSLRAGLMQFSAAAWFACLGGCATLVPKLEAPRIEVVAVQLRGGNLDQQQIRLQLHVTNPNDRAIAVRGIECQLAIEGSDFAQGSTDMGFTLPALGETNFELNVIANLNSALAVLAASLGQSRVDYRIWGRVHLQSGVLRSIPFDQKGRVRLR